ncbi:hypothetical protein [Salinilacihabitans rarus]|nr:hypothetical protein [Salinilacihabitans rarus]
MAIDRHVAERRRFARLLGTDDRLGSGLPIGGNREETADEATDDRGAD